jgi:Outer membrane protein beta-barrel domain
MRRQAYRTCVRVGAALALVVGASSAARAETYITPFIGYNFGADAGCPQGVRNCEDKKTNVGVGIGSAGALLGLEEEFAYSSKFFGDTPGVSSSVMTLMTNLMAGPKILFVRPYVVGGVGLIKTRVQLAPTSLLTTDNNFGWDVGGGVILSGAHIGVRGDIRYFHGAQNLTFLGFNLSDLKLDFGRASAGLVLTF